MQRKLLIFCCLLIGLLSHHAVAGDARKPNPTVLPGTNASRPVNYDRGSLPFD